MKRNLREATLLELDSPVSDWLLPVTSALSPLSAQLSSVSFWWHGDDMSMSCWPHSIPCRARLGVRAARGECPPPAISFASDMRGRGGAGRPIRCRTSQALLTSPAPAQRPWSRVSSVMTQPFPSLPLPNPHFPRRAVRPGCRGAVSSWWESPPPWTVDGALATAV